MAWWDFFKVFTYAFTEDPLTKRSRRDMGGAGTSQPDAIPDIRGGQDGFSGGGRGSVRLRDTNDFIDLSTVTNRIHRYKEYERLRNMAEIETAMTVFADESCFAGDTKVETPTYGTVTLRWLAENLKDERFLVYCYDQNKRDYTLGWAFNPRKTKTAMTIRVLLDDGSDFICTPDHLIMLRDGNWLDAGKLEYGSELMPFYRLQARQELTGIKTNQFPRIWTHDKGWIHERQFVDEWSTGKEKEDLQVVNSYCRMIADGLSVRKITQLTGNDFETVRNRIERAGFSNNEMKWLGKKADRRRVIGVQQHKEIDVYDLSVEKHKNFCTDWGVAHNCQKDDEGRVMSVECASEEIKSELEYLLFHRKMLNFDQKKIWNVAKQLFIMGDFFWELVIDPENPKDGILNLVPLPADSMYRIETTKGKLIEFQQSKEGPDYESLARVEVTQATDADLQQATAVRFAPEQVTHIRIGDDRKTFYPYGVSLIEAARGPAHQLRLMEDAMLVYRLCLTGDTRIRTNYGYKYIKDIEIDDIVYCMEKSGQVKPVKVSWFVNNGVQKILKVKTQHTEISGTLTHPLLINRNGTIQWVDLQDIKPKIDKIVNVQQDEELNVSFPKLDFSVVMLKQKYCFEKIDEEKLKLCIEQIALTKNIDKIKIGNSIKLFLTCKNMYGLRKTYANVVCNHFGLSEENLLTTKRKHKEVILPEFVDEDFARLFGFMLGDGSIRRSGTSMCFSASPDKELNDKYRGLLQKYFGNVHFCKDKRSIHSECGNHVVSSVSAVELMLEMGYVCKTNMKRIPDWVYTASKKIRRAFIEGISDADGCERFTKSGLWFSTISMSNKNLIEDIKEVWHSIGLCSGQLGKRIRPAKFRKSLNRIMPETKSYHITITDRELPKYDTVWSVKQAKDQQVYDFTVDHNEHNFVANGVVSMNTRAPERRVFYIDVQQLPPYKAEAFIDRMKDQFKKKKVANTQSGRPGASSVEERWHAPAADEDYWIPIKANTNTRVETLPGAQNLGEIDDTVYFRNKLFTALNFPKNYFNNEDAQSTRIALSSQDVKFARMIERLQSHIEDSFWEICDRHLKLLGYPEELYEDLQIKMTPPSDWRELTRAEVLTNRITNISTLKGSQLMSDFDLLTKFMKYPEDEVNKMLARLKIQKLDDLKLQIIAQNPTLLGVGLPGPDDMEVGVEPGGPSPMLGSDPSAGQPPEGGPTAGPQGMRKFMDDGGDDPSMGMPPQGGQPPVPGSGNVLPSPSEEEIDKYNLEIKNFESEMDEEEIDRSES